MENETQIEVDVATVAQWLKDRAQGPNEAKDAKRPTDFILLDCREEDEWETAKIEGAVLLPMSQWNDHATQLAELAGKHLVVHCHHGGRSLRVANWLRQNGFPSAQSMAGGIDAWSEEIDEPSAEVLEFVGQSIELSRSTSR